ncbi:MAG: hypothetical protein PHQ83_02340 [Eubacteriales bacterium]|nr:hypothetical protein [Eubacteriales bacterium]
MTSWITLPHPFQSGMVLQQQARTLLAGKARPNSLLTVEWTRFPLDPQTVSPHDPRYGTFFTAEVTCDGKGSFCLELPAFEASFDTYELLVTDGADKILLHDILIGDVYLFVGELTLPLQSSGLPPGPVHSGTVPAAKPYLRQLDILAPEVERIWTSQPHFEPAGADQGLLLSALARHFGREILPDIHVPVGLLLLDAPGRRLREYLPDNRKGLYRQMAALAGMGVRAIIWSGHHQELAQPEKLQTGLMKLAAALRSELRSVHGSEPAFILFHLPTVSVGQRLFYEQTLGNEALTYVRHHLAAPTALIPVSSLPGSSPLATLAERLRLICLGLLYQRKAPQSAPECESIEQVGGKLMLTFSNIGEGLRLFREDSRVRGFTICGPDRMFREAQAKVLYGVRVMVWHEAIQNPVAVTYGFYDLHDRANLISKDHLPIVPFRSDQEASTYVLPREWMHCDDPAEWQVFAGSLKIRPEKVNKSEGEGSLSLDYQMASGQGIAFGPWIDRPADFPPLDLAPAANLVMDVFNPDLKEKSLALKILAIVAPGAREIETPGQRIIPALRWQPLTFDLRPLAQEIDLTQVIRIQLVLHDKSGRGQLYLDNIRLT